MGSKISDLPAFERPREKAIRYGFDTLSDAEVLAIIISCGTKEISALDLSNIVLSNFCGLYNTINKSFSDFLKFKGIKKATAAKLCAIFEIAKRYNSLRIDNLIQDTGITTQFLYEKYINSLAEKSQECLVIVSLNSRRKVVHERMLFIGSENSINLSISNILRDVISHDGKSFYVIHNHPNGKLVPSDNDLLFTKQLITNSKRVKLKLIDHIIISRNGYYSFLSKDIKEETV